MKRMSRVIFAIMTMACGLIVISSGLEEANRCQGNVRPESLIEVLAGLGLFVAGVLILKRDALEK